MGHRMVVKNHPPAVKFARQILMAPMGRLCDIADINGDGRLDLIVSKFGQLNGSTIELGGSRCISKVPSTSGLSKK